MIVMLLFTVGCISGVTYGLGRVHGYERSEKDSNESKAFWEEVKERGL